MAGKGKDTHPGLDIKTSSAHQLHHPPEQAYSCPPAFATSTVPATCSHGRPKDNSRQYGYTLGLPLNWARTRTIAPLPEDVKTMRQPIYGHMPSRKPSLAGFFTDAWLSMAGTAEIGSPNGKPGRWGSAPGRLCRRCVRCVARGAPPPPPPCTPTNHRLYETYRPMKPPG